MNATTELIEQSIFRLRENILKIEKCLLEFRDDEIWQRPNEVSNSLGNQIVHLCGNVTQYIIAGLGEKDDNRQRDAEFEMEDGFSKMELLKKLNRVTEEASDIILQQTDESLLELREVQGFKLTGIGILIHVVEHFSYHTGQIVFWTKILRKRDMGFYDGMDL
ncbi:MAG: DUF1572 domain-containing protein [Saprospiraceae bacterium]|nr:DUF1572 domain-containing protein [Saprospiraceae bacterium]